jgi:hypothetical protein
MILKILVSPISKGHVSSYLVEAGMELVSCRLKNFARLVWLGRRF